MRVTSAMKDYIHDCMEKKVADRLDAAKKAAKEQAERDDKAVADVQKYAESLLPAMTEKVVKFAEKRGLTWLTHPIIWSGVSDDDNHAFSVGVSSNDFVETNDREANNSPQRKMRKELEDEPGRIRKALDKAVNAVVFSLELGKVKKAELEELIASTEVEL